MRSIRAFSESISTGSRRPYSSSHYGSAVDEAVKVSVIRRLRLGEKLSSKEADKIYNYVAHAPERLTEKEFKKYVKYWPKGDQDSLWAHRSERLDLDRGPQTQLIRTKIDLPATVIERLMGAGCSKREINAIKKLAGSKPRKGYLRVVDPEVFYPKSKEYKVVTTLGFVDVDDQGTAHKALEPAAFGEKNNVVKGAYFHKSVGWY